MTFVPDERFERCDLLVYSESLSNKQKAASPHKKPTLSVTEHLHVAIVSF